MTIFTVVRFLLPAALLASMTLSPAIIRSDSQRANTANNPASTSGFYSFRRDLRRCASPLCGGYFIRLVNQSRTRCANNRFQPECYVANIEWDGHTEPDKEGALLRGSMRTRGDRNGRFGVLRVSEVWHAASSNQSDGTFYRVRDRGLRCITHPCETHHEATLNSSAQRNIAGVELAGAGASDDLLSQGNEAMTGPDGILASGFHSPVRGPAGRSQILKATQFYLRAKGTVSQKPCMKTGCSSQVCADKEVITTCEWRREYECYRKATCERQSNGECGWTQTPELRACLRGQ
jgi:hypothetical protein